MISLFQKQRLKKSLLQSRRKLYQLAFSWTQDTLLADDLVQETLQKSLASLHQLRDEKKLNAWVCSILLNQYRDWLRRQKNFVDIDNINDSTEIIDQQTPLTHYQNQQQTELVRAAISRLRENHRHVITLVDLMEFSYEDVAFTLDIPIGTVMSRLCRAREQLRLLLAPHFAQPSQQQNNPIRRIK